MGLKDRFAARQLPQIVYPLRMDFTEESDVAERELIEAEADLADARARGWTDLGSLLRGAARARERRDGFYAFLTVRALPPVEFEELIAAHPPTDEQRKKHDRIVWNPDTFVPALLAAAIESDMTAADWAEVTSKGPIATGEVGALFDAAMRVNDRTPDPHMGKG